MTRPEPLHRDVSGPFWEGLSRRKLMIQRCLTCRRLIFYPRPFCHHCWAADLAWEERPPTGTLYSFTISHVPPSIDFREGWPRFPAVVAIDDDVRMATTLVDIGEPRIGMAVRLVFPDDQEQPLAMPPFTADHA